MSLYNHDLKVSDEYLAVFPKIRGLLRQTEILPLFEIHDKEAKKNKLRFHFICVTALVFGVLALLLGLLELTCAAAESIAGAVHGDTSHGGGIWGHWPAGWSLVGPALALLSILLYVIARMCGYREKWRAALFVRERIRQWHFQLFLDGDLVCRFASPGLRGGAEEVIKKRWNQFKTELQDAPAVMSAFAAAHDPHLSHPRTNYSEPVVADEVREALSVLRFQHQFQFAVKKTVEQAHDQTFSPTERDRWSEYAAKATFQIAIILAAVQFFVYGFLLMKGGAHLNHQGWSLAGLFLSAAAVLAAILNAGIRVYRSGYTLPSEPESYRIFQEQCFLASLSWSSASTLDLGALAKLENASLEELRRFLILKGSASFLF